MPPVDIAELIARLEAASEGSRELDAAIFAIVKTWPVKVLPNQFSNIQFAPSPWTTSLDAALTLVQPPGHVLYTWTMKAYVDSQHDYYCAEITVPSREFQGRSRTPALALTIAALLARAGSEK